MNTAISAQVSRRKLSKAASSALDAVRAAAAIYVVLHHAAGSWVPGSIAVAFRFGQEAVIVFFLLSGFLIFANEHDRATVRTTDYYRRRALRIYPTLLVAIFLSTLVALDNGTLFAAFGWRDLVGNIIGLQDIAALKPGVMVTPFLGNAPLWSLSYELFFYAIFPAILWLWRKAPRATNHGIGVACCASYLFYSVAPNHFLLVTAYFLIWWAAAMAACNYFGGRPILAGSAFGWLLTLCALSLLVTLQIGASRPGVYPALMLRHFSVAAGMLALAALPLRDTVARCLSPIERPAVFLASISYGLYVLHYPLLIQWRRAHSLAGAAGAVIALVLLAYLADRRLYLALRGRGRAAA